MKRGALGLLVLAVLVAMHELLAYALDHAEWIERLLAMGPDAWIAVPAALVLYALRFGLMFCGPGFALLCVLAMTRDARARWRTRALLGHASVSPRAPANVP